MTQNKSTSRDDQGHAGRKSDGTNPTEKRSEKRAQFEGGGKRSPVVKVAPLAVLAIVAVAAGVLMFRGGSDKPATVAGPPATRAAGGGETVAIPVAEVSDGQVHFYETDVNGTTVRYLAVKGTDGKIHTALDACQVCFQAKKGYTQQGDTVVCGNCGRSFPIDQIGVQHGGCNPIAVESTIKDDQLLIDPAGISDGVQFFQ